MCSILNTRAARFKSKRAGWKWAVSRCLLPQSPSRAHVESAPHIHVLHLEMHGETPLSFETVRKTQIALVAEVDSATGRPFGPAAKNPIAMDTARA